MLGNTLFLSDYSVVLTRPVFRCPKNIDFTGFFYVFLWQRSFRRGIFIYRFRALVKLTLKSGETVMPRVLGLVP